MGLLDVLSGMSNAEPGQRVPGSSDGGMSPITKAIIGGSLTRPSRPSQAVRRVPAPTLVNQVLKRLVADSMICSKVGWVDYSEAALLEAG